MDPSGNRNSLSLRNFVNEVTRRHKNIFPFEPWAFEAEKHIVQDGVKYYTLPLSEEGVKLFIKYLSQEAVKELPKLVPRDKNDKNKKEYERILLGALKVIKTLASEASSCGVWISTSDAEEILDEVLASRSQPKSRDTLPQSFL
ncbi:MAG: hypothetical protein AAB840_01425 [Patescibacteria group bacterium]